MSISVTCTPLNEGISDQSELAGKFEANCVGGLLSAEFDNIGLATRPSP
jgi:hypothetical protein